MVGLGRTVEPPIIGRITAALRYAAYRWVVTAHVTGREVAARRLRVVVLLIDIQDKFSGMYACSTYKLTIIEVYSKAFFIEVVFGIVHRDFC